MVSKNTSIKILGAKRVARFLDGASNEVYDKVDQEVKKAGLFIQAEVQKSIAGQRAEPKSVDTGRFLNSVKSTQKKKLTANVETNVAYAGVLEYGSSTRKPRKHFTNTATRNTKKVEEFIEKKVREAIR